MTQDYLKYRTKTTPLLELEEFEKEFKTICKLHKPVIMLNRVFLKKKKTTEQENVDSAIGWLIHTQPLDFFSKRTT